MKRSDLPLIIITADDESPDCGCCDHFDEWVITDEFGNKHDGCCECCGPEHCWAGYQRTIEDD